MDAVKLEGGDPARVAAAKAVVDAGVAAWATSVSPRRASAFWADSDPRVEPTTKPRRWWSARWRWRRRDVSPSC